MSYSPAIGGTPKNVSDHYLLMNLTTSATSFQSEAKVFEKFIRHSARTLGSNMNCVQASYKNVQTSLAALAHQNQQSHLSLFSHLGLQ